MKFTPIYLYGSLISAAAFILIIVLQQSSQRLVNINIEQLQNIPDDEIHRQFISQLSNTPGKENVSDSYKQKLSDLKAAAEKNPEDTLALRKYADFLVLHIRWTKL